MTSNDVSLGRFVAVAHQEAVALLQQQVLGALDDGGEPRVQDVRHDETNAVRPVGLEAARDRARGIVQLLDGPQYLLAGLRRDRARPVVDHVGDRGRRHPSQLGHIVPRHAHRVRPLSKTAQTESRPPEGYLLV